MILMYDEKEVIFLQSFKSVLQVIYYLIWIPVGILLLAGVIFLIVANPLEKLGQFGPGGDAFGGPPDRRFGPDQESNQSGGSPDGGQGPVQGGYPQPTQ